MALACASFFFLFFFSIVLHCVINTFSYCLVLEVFTDYGHLFAGFEYLIGGVMVRVLTSSAVDRWFKPRTIKKHCLLLLHSVKEKEQIRVGPESG